MVLTYLPAFACLSPIPLPTAEYHHSDSFTILGLRVLGLAVSYINEYIYENMQIGKQTGLILLDLVKLLIKLPMKKSSLNYTIMVSEETLLR